MHYGGSTSIDQDFLDAANVLPNEQVDVFDINNGARFTTYAITTPRGRKTFGVNGDAARLVQPGDSIIAIACAQMDESEARRHAPSVVLFDDENNIKY